jgi:uncharacterized membrane protein YqjE
MARASPPGDGGIVGNVRGLAADGVRAVRTRLELFGIEAQEEKARVIRQIVIAAASLYVMSLGILLAVLWLVMTSPAEQRALVLGLIAILFLAAGGGALAWLWYENSTRKSLFTATISVLRSDEQALEGNDE